MQTVLFVAIGVIGVIGVIVALTYELLGPARQLEPPVATPAEWVTRPYRQNLGRHMCRTETGEYLGRIEWVGYSNGGRTPVYSTTIVGPARTHEDGATTYPVRYVTVPVASVFVTDWKCAEGKP